MRKPYILVRSPFGLDNAHNEHMDALKGVLPFLKADMTETLSAMLLRLCYYNRNPQSPDFADKVNALLPKRATLSQDAFAKLFGIEAKEIARSGDRFDEIQDREYMNKSCSIM